MTTRVWKPRRKPSGAATRSLRSKCKTKDGWQDEHQPANEPHPSIPSITRTVCSACGAVLDWISIEERERRDRSN